MFGRRRARQQMPVVTRRPAAVIAGGDIGGQAGWRNFGHGQHASDQIGAFDGSLLNQFPAYWNDVQLRQGVEGLRSGWYSPTRSVVPYWQQTTYPTPVGGVRAGQGVTGMTGPLAARRMMANVTAAQVRQSGLAAMEWAQGLRAQSE